MAQKTKKKLIRVWAIVSALVLILLTVATVLTQFVMQDVLASLLGRDVAVYAEGVTPLYTTEYTNKDEVYQAANKLNERICEEGFVLLKNEGNALPLASGSRITVFGKNSVKPCLWRFGGCPAAISPQPSTSIPACRMRALRSIRR